MLNQRHVTKPFTTLAQNCKESTIVFFLEKMVTTFLSSQRRDTHQNATIVVTIISELLSEFSNDAKMVVTLLKSTIVNLLEHAMMVEENLPSRPMIFNLFINLFRAPAYMVTPAVRLVSNITPIDSLTNKLFSPHLLCRCTVLAGLRIITEKNMSYYASFYFQFMTKFAKLNHGIAREFLPQVRSQVICVEKLRGVDHDASLRQV